MSIRRRGASWQVRVRPFPDQSFPLKEQADLVEADLKKRKALGQLYVEKPETFGAVLDAHLDRKLAMGGKKGTVRPATQRFYRQSKKPWEPLRETLIPNLRRSLVEDHIEGRAAKAPVAARNELQFAKAALRSAEARGQNVDRGIFTIQPVRHEAVEGRTVTLEQLDAIAAWMPDRVKRIVPFCGTVGLRWSEAVNLTDEMIVWGADRTTTASRLVNGGAEAGVAPGEFQDARPGDTPQVGGASLLIPRDLNKSRREKTVPLAKVEVQLLREQLLARPAGTTLVFPNARGTIYSESGFRKVFGRATRRAGLDGFRFHWLRHTAISLMATAGMAPEVIAQRVGHSDGGALVFKRYRHVYPSEIGAAVGLIDALIANAEAQDEETG